MRALTINGPGDVRISEIPVAAPGPQQIQVRTALVGVCGTDAHLISGDSFYLEHGFQTYPFVFGHEYTGVVSAVGAGVTTVAVGDRVVGHTMVPCHRCDNCQRGAAHLCRQLAEVGLRFIQGAAAEYVTVPDFAVTRLPAGLSFEAAVLVEPGVAAYRACVRLGLRPTDRVAVIGTGTLGLLALLFARLTAARVDVIGVADSELALARELGADVTSHPADVPAGRYDAVIEASGSPDAFGIALTAADLGARIALIGLPSTASSIDQTAVTLKDLTVFGVLHGLAHYGDVVALFAAGAVDPRPLIAAVLTPEEALTSLTAAPSAERPPRRAPKNLLTFATGPTPAV
jgi:threonine dehydrogenase-like Zn-dependent dehydrogenase